MGKEEEFKPEISNQVSIALASATNTAIDLQKITNDFPVNCNPAIYEKELERVTMGNCLIASKAVLTCLYENSHGLFSSMILLKSHKDVSRVNGQPFKENIGINHYYYLVEDISGAWHAGSPANHKRHSGDNSRLTRTISGSLEKVLEKITEVEGGIWPTSKQIIIALKNNPSMPLQDEYGKNTLIFFNTFGNPLKIDPSPLCETLNGKPILPPSESVFSLA